MAARLPEPEDQPGDVAARFVDYLDFYRSVVEAKLDGLDEAELRRSRLPSGWTPLELLRHLVHMERRWLRWGFLGEPVDAPWGDAGADGRWQVDADDTLESLLGQLHQGGRLTRSIVERARLEDLSATGGRFCEGSRQPTLAWILFHVLQEYARHAGHLDIVRELADGVVGE